ncbi:MAG: glycerophosphodiester phosphodiesterase family protein [Bacteroidetes bacterium]|nr:glycerophosphodiester phosphodiesterase family protein [Bacteroidota bacterium]
MKKILALAFLLLLIEITHAQKAMLPQSKHKFIVIAHRGDHVDVPENTIAAYENAIKHEADYVEIDLRTTKDSVLVIMHDATMDRMTNGKGKVSDFTFADLRKLNVIDKRKDSSEKYPIPTFEEVLKTCRNKIHIYLDFKDASVMQSYKAIKKYGMEKQVIVYINSEEQYKDWRKLVPAMPLMLSMPDTIKNANQLKFFLAQYPLELLDGDYSDYTPEILKAAKAAGKTVWPDIQSASENLNWDKSLELGFTGLQTDHPKALIDYLKKKGLR